MAQDVHRGVQFMGDEVLLGCQCYGQELVLLGNRRIRVAIQDGGGVSG